MSKDLTGDYGTYKPKAITEITALLLCTNFFADF